MAKQKSRSRRSSQSIFSRFRFSTILLALLLLGGLIAAIALTFTQQDIRQAAASCPHGVVDVQYRLHNATQDLPWKSGSALGTVTTGTNIDVNCFSNSGSSLLPNGVISAKRNGQAFSIPASAFSGTTQIRNFRLTEPGTYVFSCSNGSSCSNSDTLSVTGSSLSTPPPTANPGPGDVACTADAKQCPDGSFVGRDPANGCAFRECPKAADPDLPGDACENIADINEDCKVDTQDYTLFINTFKEEYRP